MTRPVFIDGTSVTLRVQTDQEPSLKRGRNHPAVRRYIAAFRRPTRTGDDTDGGDDPSASTVIVPKDEEFGPEAVGAVSLEPIQQIDGYGNLGVWLLPEAWGRGYALDSCAHMIEYGFRELALHRVSATVMQPNDRSRRLCERLGFSHEGTAREAQFADGEYVDVDRYGLLVDEWTSPENVLDSSGPD